jgi:hypothetical protein
VAALAIAIAAPPAGAVTVFPPGEYTAGVIDRSSLFSDLDQRDEFLEPEGQGETIDVGDEQRTVVKITEINTGRKRLDLTDGTKYVLEDGGQIDYLNGLLSGLLYDLKIGRILDEDGNSVQTVETPDPGEDPVTITIEKTRAGRYLSNTGSDGTWTDTVGAPGDLISDGPVDGVTYGGLLVIYEDPARNSLFVGDQDQDNAMEIGPWDWREPGDLTGDSEHPGAAVMDVPGVLTNADYFPTVSDVPGSNTDEDDSGTAEPWLVIVLVDLFDIPVHTMGTPIGPVAFPANPYGVADGTYLLERNFELGPGGSVDFDGLAFGNIIGGTAAGMFNLGNFTIYGDDGTTIWRADMRIEFEGENRGDLLDGWQIDSDDPAQFGVSIPEPATMSLLGLSLLGLAGTRLRRRKHS